MYLTFASSEPASVEKATNFIHKLFFKTCKPQKLAFEVGDFPIALAVLWAN